MPIYYDTSGVSALPVSLYDLDKAALGGVASEWQAQQTIYHRVWPYFDNSIFDTAVQRNANGSTTPLWPLRIGMVRRACITHAQHLWGLTADSAHVRFTCAPKAAAADSRRDKARERANVLAQTLTNLFNWGPHPELWREGGRLFNVFGGIFIRLQADPDSPYGLAFDLLSPEVVFPIWHPMNYKRLMRVHVVSYIDAELARATYGYRGKETGGLVEYAETWTPESWQVTLGHPGISERQAAIDSDTGEPLQGRNAFIDPITGRPALPIVYVPRLRTGRSYGLSLADELIGLQDEFNARMADYGDAVSFASQPHIWGRDLSRKRTTGPLRLPRGDEIFDAGDTGATGKQPELAALPGPNISQSTSLFTNKVEDVLYDQAAIPPVMRGIDEGSQRSGATLEARAIPTLAMVDDYRAAWGYALTLLAGLALRYAFNYNGGMLGELKITKSEFGHQARPIFAPVLPRDIQAINQTIQIQRPAGTMSIERAVSLSPDVTDPEEELARIQKEKQAEEDAQVNKMKLQAEIQAANRPPAATKEDV